MLMLWEFEVLQQSLVQQPRRLSKQHLLSAKACQVLYRNIKILINLSLKPPKKIQVSLDSRSAIPSIRTHSPSRNPRPSCHMPKNQENCACTAMIHCSLFFFLFDGLIRVAKYYLRGTPSFGHVNTMGHLANFHSRIIFTAVGIIYCSHIGVSWYYFVLP